MFSRSAERIFGRDEREAIAAAVAGDPEGAPVEPGTNGIRKIRFGIGNKGKSGGARVLYLHFSREAPIYLLLAYPKSRQEKMSADERKAVRLLVEAIKAQWKARNE